MEEKNQKIFDDVCNFFGNNNVMTNEDFNDICDYHNWKNTKIDEKKTNELDDMIKQERDDEYRKEIENEGLKEIKEHENCNEGEENE
jgi:hypothetical protein